MARPPPDPLYTLRGLGAAVNTLHFSCSEPARPLLFSGSSNGAVHIWDLTTRRSQKVLKGHADSSILWLDSLSRENLISQGRDMRVCLWSLAEGRADVTDSLFADSVGFCQCSLMQGGQGTWLLAHPTDCMEEVKVIELPTKAPLGSLKPESKLGMVMCMKLLQTNSGPMLVAGYEDGTLVLWDVSQRRPLSSLKAHLEPVMSLDFDPSRLKGVSGSAEQTICSWTLDGQQVLQLQEQVELVNPGISQLCLRPDGKILASAGWDHLIRVFGWKKMKPLAVLQYHRDMVLSVTFSDHQDPKQRMMAAASKDERISLWSIYN
ncbi:guanine nucleotide-binding protein subunit beta-like protein 1 [Denticeps clupeoides]|uniref:Guanine nucleotide-binding protein subunit beta-like protein 1 n=1 Tax=Denticeps clupeoides TaxID=299321 RepID=A0AAY4BIX9_9TELE|nr:guanine nucleotide-binding protein subunit beta-like protein 1 [Denticeps clupeoides]XP_028852973.1 guanine nucleotide-binding protein subunit beta-like protein 1 [Denticeps clupeoides]XP_028852974.1 guanine nucleotide-binding protein subunit beta-like protein 1 [Denticeps clupeoides]